MPITLSPYGKKFGRRKPGPWARLNTSHPLAPDTFCALCNEGGGSPRDIKGKRQGTLTGTGWNVGRTYVGPCLSMLSANVDRVDWGPDSAILPTAGITIALAYRKRDAVNRASGVFGQNAGGSTSTCGAHIPYSDGVVYWDFGGQSSPNRLSVSGLTFGDDLWVFTAGARGSEIWQNGQLRASQGTAITRTSSANNWFWGVHAGGSGCDLADFGFFDIYSTQLPKAIIPSLYYPPFAFLLQPAASRGIWGTAASASAGSIYLPASLFAVSP